DGPRDDTGPTMAYDVPKGQIGFSGPVVAGRPTIHVSDERIIIDAQKIDWTLDGKNMVADGDVKSVLKPQPQQQPAQPGQTQPGAPPAAQKASGPSAQAAPAAQPGAPQAPGAKPAGGSDF